MKEEERLKSIPYGKADFAEFKKRNLYFVDKTRYIRDIEEKGYFLFFIRPRRFGKSLFLSIMENYYDIERKNQFDLIFKGTDIHKEPTPERNQYMVLKFNFGMIEPAQETLEDVFLEYIKSTAIYFLTKYQKYLSIDIDKVEANIQSMKRASTIVGSLLSYCIGKEEKLYVIIDEYDNFANTILSTSGQQAFLDITRGEGFFRSFFNVLKGGATGADAPISRLFMTGVSPITLDDVTSGFNIATNISLDPDINEVLGFTTEEVENLIDYYRQAGKIKHSTPELMELLSQWYNHYRFSIRSSRDVFNTTLVLYFLREYVNASQIPDTLVDRNTRIDYNKLRHLILVDKKGILQTNGNFSQLQHIMETGSIHSRIETGFPIDQLTNPNNFISLLYYFGLLTIKGIDEERTPVLAIPNETVKQLYYDYISKTFEETGGLSLNTFKYEELIKGMAYRGNWKEFIAYITERMEEALSIRDLISGEKTLQVFWNVYLGLGALYNVYSEKELNQGFADLTLIPLLFQYPAIKYSYLIELKYIKPSDYEKKDGPDKVETLRSEAAKQLTQYSLDEKFRKTVSHTTLKKLILIFSGNKLIHHSEI